MIETAAPPLVHTARLEAELAAAGLPGVTVILTEPSVGLLRVEGATEKDRDTVEAVVKAHDPSPGPSLADRLATVEAELRGMRERAAAATSVTGGAAVVRDAITGNSA
jgi:hypothetical protein